MMNFFLGFIKMFKKNLFHSITQMQLQKVLKYILIVIAKRDFYLDICSELVQENKELHKTGYNIEMEKRENIR